PTSALYTLSLHDALPILRPWFLPDGRQISTVAGSGSFWTCGFAWAWTGKVVTDCEISPPKNPALTAATNVNLRFMQASATAVCRDRKSTRLNSSHDQISY